MHFDKSLSMQQRAEARIPGVTQLLSKRPDRFAPGVWPGYYDRASGVEVWDLDANRYIDMSIGGIGATILGFADADVDRAVVDAVSRGSASSLNCPEEIELADLLCGIHSWADQVRYARGGGEAMVIAVRIARAHTKKDTIAFCGYHGWHDWYLAANLGEEDALDGHLIKGLAPTGVPRALRGTALPFHYNNIEELEDIVRERGKELAAIVMEPIRSEQPQDGFLSSVRSIADDLGIPLIFDEVSSGFRLGSGGAHLDLDVEPDIAVFSKAMGNGYPIAAVIGRAGVMRAAGDSFISSTMWTERIGPVAALATIRKFQDVKAYEHIGRIGFAVQEGWKRVAKKHSIQITVSGLPAIGHFAFDHQDSLAMKALFVRLMRDQGFLASTAFYGMYAHTMGHVVAYLQAVDVAFGEIALSIRSNSLQKKLQGAPAVSGFKRFA